MTCIAHGCASKVRATCSASVRALPAARARASTSSTLGAAAAVTVCSSASATRRLVSLREISLHFRGFAARDAALAPCRATHITSPCARFRFHVGFALRAAAPGYVEHPRAPAQKGVERIAVLGGEGVRFQKRFGMIEERLLNLVQQNAQTGRHLVQRNRGLLSLLPEGAIAPHQRGDALREIARAQLDANRHAPQLPFVEFPSRGLVAQV